MKKIPSCMLIAIMAIGMTGPVIALAESGQSVSVEAKAGVEAQASTSRLNNLKTQVKNQVESAKNSIASTTASLKEKIEQRLEKRLEKMVERYQATIDRENSILKRIESRIQKVKNVGGKTEVSEKFALEARTEISLATSSLSTFKATIISIDNATTSATSTPGQITKENISKLKKAAAEVEKHIRLAHKAMVNAIVNLKGMSSVNATSSTEVKTQN